MKKMRKSALLLILCLCMALPLTGCRESAAISQLVWGGGPVLDPRELMQNYNNDNDHPGRLNQETLREDGEDTQQDTLTGRQGEENNAEQTQISELNTEQEYDNKQAVPITLDKAEDQSEDPDETEDQSEDPDETEDRSGTKNQNEDPDETEDRSGTKGRNEDPDEDQNEDPDETENRDEDPDADPNGNGRPAESQDKSENKTENTDDRSTDEELPVPGSGEGENPDPDNSSGGGEVDENAETSVPDGGGEETDAGGGGAGTGEGAGEHNDGETETGGEIEAEPDTPDTPEPDKDGGGNDDDADKEIVSDDGDKVDPVDNSGKVAATGQLAILVSMLGGSDRLCATSQDYRSNTLAQKAFDSRSVPALWSGDGSAGMTEENFQALLELQPGMVLELSGQATLTGDQIARLEQAGIEYHAVPNFKTAASVENCVNVVAQYLGDQSASGGTDAPAIAESYLDWCDSVRSSLSETWTTNTVFIEDWDDQVEAVIAKRPTSAMINDPYTAVWSDTGAAVIRLGTRGDPLDDYLGYAQVTDYAKSPIYLNYLNYTLFTAWNKVVGCLGAPYTADGSLCYITPLGRCKTSTESDYFNHMADGIQEIIGVWKNSYSFGALPYLGTSTFPTVIVRDSSVKEAIESSASWKVYIDNSGPYPGYGFYLNGTDWRTATDMDIVGSSIRGEYNVYVNPEGLGSWVDGSPESILETVWAAWAVQNQGDASAGYTLNAVKAKIRDFYSTFYHYDLSDAELTDILNLE